MLSGGAKGTGKEKGEEKVAERGQRQDEEYGLALTDFVQDEDQTLPFCFSPAYLLLH